MSLRVVVHLQDPALKKKEDRYVSMMRTLSVFVLTLVGGRIVKEKSTICVLIYSPHDELASACVATQGAVWRGVIVLHPGTKDYNHSGQVHDIQPHPWSWHSNNVNRSPALTS